MSNVSFTELDPFNRAFFETYLSKMRFLEEDWGFAKHVDPSYYGSLLLYTKGRFAIMFSFELRDNRVYLRMQQVDTAIPDVFPPEAFPDVYSRIQDPLFELFLRLPLREEYQQFFSKAERKRLEQLIELAVVQRDVEAARAVLEKEAEFHAYILRKYQPQILQVVEAASAESGEA
jgi:hypothetical protein